MRWEHMVFEYSSKGEDDVLKVVHEHEISLGGYDVLYSQVYVRVLAVVWMGGAATHLIQTKGTRET